MIRSMCNRALVNLRSRNNLRECSNHTRRNYGVFLKPLREASFNKVNEVDIEYFNSVLGSNHIVSNKSDLEPFNVDWLGKYAGESTLMLKPKDTKQVCEILQYCNKRNLAIVPQGGNTGLVGGSVPVYDEIILSMSGLNRIIEFDPVSGIVTLEAGVILQDADEYLRERSHIFPLDLGAKGSCQVGGNASTNAGGLRFLRYGSMHSNILGLEVVLSTGEVLSQLSSLSKNNTGYDLKDIFIGSEGTLGIITKLSVKCFPLPKSVNLLFLGIDSYQYVQELFLEARKDLGEILSAFEFLDRKCMEIVLKHHTDFNDPLGTNCPFYVLIETHGSNIDHDKEKIEFFLEKITNLAIIIDGVVAQDQTQQNSLWALRENVPESFSKLGKVYKYDLSLPVNKIYDLVEELRSRLSDNPSVVVAGYGHLGDCNVHLNVCEPNYSENTLQIIEPFVYEYTSSFAGSISAEHGIGLMKPNHLHYSKSSLSIKIMKQLKNSLDPKGILNPYKVLPGTVE